MLPAYLHRGQIAELILKFGHHRAMRGSNIPGLSERTQPAQEIWVTVLKSAVAWLLVLAAVSIAMPLYPLLPSAGLDPSWRYAVSQAEADGLAFGREVIYTVGPYAGVYTRLFHPAIDPLMLAAGAFFGLCFGTVCVLLARGSLLWGACLLYVVAGQMFGRDVFFASYGLLLVVAICNRASCVAGTGGSPSRFESLVFLVLLSALGLLPLIKVSLIVTGVAASLSAFCFFVAIGSPFLAAGSVLVPAIAMIFFWTLASQLVTDLPAYLANSFELMGGYTEAMATDGPVSEVALFAVAGVSVLCALLTTAARPVFKLSLVLAFGAFLFSAFKGGFVRHDEHALFAAGAIILAAVLIKLMVWQARGSLAIVLVAAVTWFSIDYRYLGSAREILYSNLFRTYAEGVEGFRLRTSPSVDLGQAFSTSVKSIAQQVDFPRLPGRSDIYNYGQSYLLASGNGWNPRPLLQSYAAFTPRLAGFDRDHLAGGNAPDNLLFRLETIDGRLPSLDDGASWPIMLSRYALADDPGDNDYILLQRAKGTPGSSVRRLMSRRIKFDETVDLPADKLLYAEIDARPSLLGKFALFAYKTRPLQLTLIMADGRLRAYRLVAGMARAGFLLSPLVENTQEFAYLFGDSDILKENVVHSIRLSGSPLLWNSEYELTLSTFEPSTTGNGSTKDGDREIIADPPAGLPVVSVASCEGWIDHVNGLAPAAPIRIANLITADGWMTIAGKQGTTPDKVYVTLTAADGRVWYGRTRRSPRPDVAVFFGRPEMRSPGFTATLDASHLPDDLVLGLARENARRLERCGNFNMPLVRRRSPVLTGLPAAPVR